jgi:hypothetical protein
MDKAEQYRDEAAAALELSAFAKDKMSKMALLIIAKGWLELAQIVSSQNDPPTEVDPAREAGRLESDNSPKH